MTRYLKTFVWARRESEIFRSGPIRVIRKDQTIFNGFGSDERQKQNPWKIQFSANRNYIPRQTERLSASSCIYLMCKYSNELNLHINAKRHHSLASSLHAKIIKINPSVLMKLASAKRQRQPTETSYSCWFSLVLGRKFNHIRFVLRLYF